MAYQRVDKKHPKIVPDGDLEGFCYKLLEDGAKEYLLLDRNLVIIWNSLFGDQEYPIRVEDIPNLVKALWAAYALAEKREMENSL
jgi:hypothetical protein